MLNDELKHRLEKAIALAAIKDQSVPDGRPRVEAMLGFEVCTHHLLEVLPASAHDGAGLQSGHSHE